MNTEAYSDRMRARDTAGYQAAAPGRATNIDILVLDDSRFDADRLRRDFGRTGLPVRVDSVSGISEFRRSIDGHRYDMVFVDYILPEADGISACQMIRESSVNATVPMVMITNEARHDIAVSAMRTGCLDYLDKDALAPDRLRELVLAGMDAIGDQTTDIIRRELSHHRMELLDLMRSVVRREVAHRDNDPARETLQDALIALGVLPMGGRDTNWDNFFGSEEETFDFGVLKH